jgi:hypothetical protein
MQENIIDNNVVQSACFLLQPQKIFQMTRLSVGSEQTASRKETGRQAQN